MKQLFFLFFISLFFPGCLTRKNMKIQNSPQKGNQFKTKIYSEKKELVFESIMSSLQEMGYLIHISHFANGLITANIASSQGVLRKIFYGYPDFNDKNITVYLEKISHKKTLVLINFSHSIEKDNESKKILSINDPKVYETIFKIIKRNIFIRK